MHELYVTVTLTGCNWWFRRAAVSVLSASGIRSVSPVAGNCVSVPVSFSQRVAISSCIFPFLRPFWGKKEVKVAPTYL